MIILTMQGKYLIVEQQVLAQLLCFDDNKNMVNKVHMIYVTFDNYRIGDDR